MPRIFTTQVIPRNFLKGIEGETHPPRFTILNEENEGEDITSLTHKGSNVLNLNRTEGKQTLTVSLGCKPTNTLFTTINTVLRNLGQGCIYKYKGNVYLDSHNPNTYFDPTKPLVIKL